MPKRTLDFREELLKDLADPSEAAHYIDAALEDSEEMFLVALRDVAEARQMSKVANAAGVARESIYRMLSATGNPTHSNLIGILKALDLRLSVEAISVPKAKKSLRSSDFARRKHPPSPGKNLDAAGQPTPGKVPHATIDPAAAEENRK